MSWEEAGSPGLSLSGFSSLVSISSAAPPPPARRPSLSLSIGTSGGAGAGGEEQPAVSSDEGQKSVRAMKNRESALRSRARKKAYTQELEKEVRRLVDDNLKLKRQCKQLQLEIAALTGQQPGNKQSSPHRRTSSTQF